MNESDEEGGWTFKLLVFGWRTCVQIFYVGVTLYVFSRLQNNQETLMVALFGLIYVAIRSIAIGNVMFLRGIVIAFQGEIDAIKVAVIPEFQIDLEARKDAAEAIKKTNHKLWFDYAGLSVISLICLVSVFSAI